MSESWIKPNWKLPFGVNALVTTRLGGSSSLPYSQFNLAQHVGDNPEVVNANRSQLERGIGLPIQWLNQVHSTCVIQSRELYASSSLIDADGVIANTPKQVCAVLTADCLPILLCNASSTSVAAVHAGWRGLAAGIVAKAVKAMNLSAPSSSLSAYLGPAISVNYFEVGSEVRAAFFESWQKRGLNTQGLVACFHNLENSSDKFHADLFAIARLELLQLDVSSVSGGEWCTWRDNSRFYSYRKSNQTGRFASLIWLN